MTRKFLSVLCVASSIFYIYTGIGGYVAPIVQLSPLVLVALLLAFLDFPLSKKHAWTRLIDYSLGILSVVIIIYLIKTEFWFVGAWQTVSGIGLVFAYALIGLILEATRRVIGMAMPLIALVFFLYGYFGKYMTGTILYHAPLGWDRLADIISYSYMGIWGTPVNVCATIVIFFLIFAAFLRVCGATTIFNELSASVFGRFSGGPAKMAVVASGFFGMLSGSSIANVQTTGVFTIPLMKKTGYKPEMAGAFETLASVGGQFMPPIMGATAFVLAGIIGVPYWDVVVAAFLPAVLYYISLFTVVHLEAIKEGIKGLTKDELPSPRKALLKSWIVILPLGVLVVSLGVFHYTAMRSVLITLLALIVCSSFMKETRLTPSRLWEALDAGTRSVTTITVACACAGIIMGIVFISNVGIALSAGLITVSQGILPVLLILCMGCSLLLGMGLTTTACYLILAILVAPAMVKLGVSVMAAHLFVFYFGALSSFTPPVCMTAYAAAPLAGAKPMSIGWLAWRLGIIAYIVPFMFVYSPTLLLQGSPANLILGFLTAVAGVIGFGAALQGYLLERAHIIQRILLGVGGLALIIPSWQTDLFGVALLIMPTIWQLAQRRSKKADMAIYSLNNGGDSYAQSKNLSQ